MLYLIGRHLNDTVNTVFFQDFRIDKFSKLGDLLEKLSKGTNVEMSRTILENNLSKDSKDLK
jgi:hypothetical protein